MQTHDPRFDPFVSDLLRQSLRRRPAGYAEPFGELVPAALLFGDLSGFTELAERLASDLSRGAEETQRILNRHFGRVLEVIERWGGTVLKLAGDATIALWPASPADANGLARAAQHATACGLEIQARIHEARLSEKIALGHRVAVAAGPVWLAHVGGVDDKWEFVASGEPWSQIRAADAVAAPGSVVVSAEVHRLLGTLATRSRLDNGCYRVRRCRLQPSAADPSLLRPPGDGAASRYLSQAFRAHIEAGHREWLAEYRRVSVLFVQIAGIDEQHPDALRQLHAATRLVQRTVGDHAGHLLQLVTDDKGLVALSAWGLPLACHEDDAERALRAARELQSGLSKLGLSVRSGVKTGRVFAGLLGRDQHLEYAIIGDPVNEASRIMAAASGEPLCDEATRDAAQRRFVFEPIGQVPVKGKRAALALHRVLIERVYREQAPRDFVGRAHEREQLRDALDRMLSSVTPLLHVIGPPGIGKSSLIRHVLSEAEARGRTGVLGSGDAAHRGAAYFPFAAVLPRLLEHAGLSRAGVDTRGMLEALGLRGELAPLLNPLLPFALPETLLTETLDGAGRADTTRELLTDITAAALTRTPLVLVLDDLQFFDSASWSLLATLQRKLPHLPIVALSRPLDDTELPSDARRMLDAPTLERLRLGPLSPDDSRSLIAARLGVRAVSDDLAQRVYERAEGHPLFTEELLLSLEQAQVIRRVEPGATLVYEPGGLGRLSLGAGLEAVIASRIDGLDPAQQLTIKVASVLGRRFELPLLAAVRPIALPLAELSNQLEAICSSQLLERDAASGYRFHHTLVQEAVNGLLVSDQQRQLHRAAAELLERQEGNQPRSWARLAQHWSIAEDDLKAIEYLELAALKARQDHSLIEAAGFLRDACERAERRRDVVPAERIARWEHLLGEAEVELGMPALAELHLTRALDQLDRLQPRGRAELALGLARACTEHARLRLARPQKSSSGRERSLTAARCYATLAQVYYNNHELGRMLHATLVGANLALRAGGDSRVLARVLANLSIAAVSVPGLDPDHYADEALEMAERLGDPTTLQEVLMVVANYELGAARFASATAHFQRAIALAPSTGETLNWEISLGSLANVYRLRGDFRRADDADHSLLRSGFERSVAQAQVWGFFGRACSLTYLNRYDELAALLPAFERLLDDPEVTRQVSASNVVAQLLTRALLDLQLRQPMSLQAARRALARSVELLDSLDHLQAYMTCTISYLHCVVMACWRRDPSSPEVARWAAQADRFVERCGRQFPSAVPQMFIGRGLRARRAGKPRTAAAAFQKALHHALLIDNPFDQAWAHHELSQCSALSVEEQAQHAIGCRYQLHALQLTAPLAWSA